MPYTNLLADCVIGDLAIKNRVVLAPLTRCMASPGQVPSENMLNFYRNRSQCGLLITEATCISKDANAYENTPGIYTPEQIKAWKTIVSAVQKQQSKMFIQLWHAGMMGHSYFRDGKLPLSPSGVKPLKTRVPRLRLSHEAPKTMDLVDFERVKQEFVDAALQSIHVAGFDGIELHASNGYLLDSFLHFATNQRTDNYGGSPQNMCRYILEIIDEIAKHLKGYQKIGLRISPVTPTAMEALPPSPQDERVFIYLLGELNMRNIAYVHVGTDDDKNERGFFSSKVSTFVRKHYKGFVIAGGNYTLDEAESLIQDEGIDFAYFGKKLIANPNLVSLLSETTSPILREFEPQMIASPP